MPDPISGPHDDGSSTALRRLAENLRAARYDFTTITPRSHAIVNGRPENARARDLRDVFGWSRPFAEALLPPGVVQPLRDAGALEAGGGLLRSRVRFSTLRGDIFVHSAFPTADVDAVFFGPDTYKFIDAVADHLARRVAPVTRAADVCTGSGAAAITVAKAAPQADVLMVDINPLALRYAAVNAAVAGCRNARPCRSNKLEDVDGDFDLVVAHPPYLIDEHSRAYRHGGGARGADLAQGIVDGASRRLRPGGTLLLFTGVAIVGGADPFRKAIEPGLADAGCEWTYREVDPDVFGEELAHPSYGEVDRIALVVLEATRAAMPRSGAVP